MALYLTTVATTSSKILRPTSSCVLLIQSGGENTVRSFREQELGPKDDLGNPVGGETMALKTYEEWRKIVT